MKKRLISTLGLILMSLSLVSCSNSLDNVQYDLAREFISSQNEEKEQQEQDKKQAQDLELEQVVVKKVIDGDTFVTADNEKIRLIGVNTPESTTKIEEYGKEASDYTKSVLTGKTVYLQKDTSETDIYGRKLRIVWLEVPSSTKDLSEIQNKMFNADLVIKGYAQASTYEPDIKYSELFRELSRQARTDKKGLWAIFQDGTTKGDTL